MWIRRRRRRRSLLRCVYRLSCGEIKFISLAISCSALFGNVCENEGGFRLSAATATGSPDCRCYSLWGGSLSLALDGSEARNGSLLVCVAVVCRNRHLLLVIRYNKVGRLARVSIAFSTPRLVGSGRRLCTAPLFSVHSYLVDPASGDMLR